MTRCHRVRLGMLQVYCPSPGIISRWSDRYTLFSLRVPYKIQDFRKGRCYDGVAFDLIVLRSGLISAGMLNLWRDHRLIL